jgi:hypothetical protein
LQIISIFAKRKKYKFHKIKKTKDVLWTVDYPHSFIFNLALHSILLTFWSGKESGMVWFLFKSGCCCTLSRYPLYSELIGGLPGPELAIILLELLILCPWQSLTTWIWAFLFNSPLSFLTQGLLSLVRLLWWVDCFILLGRSIVHWFSSTS